MASSRLKRQLDDSGGSGGSKLNESFVSVRKRLSGRPLINAVRHGATLACGHQEGALATSICGRAELPRTPTSSCRSGSRTYGTRRADDGFTERSRVRRDHRRSQLTVSGGFSAGVRCATPLLD